MLTKGEFRRMDFSKPAYDPKTNNDIALVLQLWKRQQTGAGKPLNRLKKTATALQDNALLGFVWFHFADLYYYREPDYERFKKSITNAIRTLMHSSETELLARAYNFVGFDAVNYGSYDVAYNYYMTGLKICEHIPDAVVPGIINTNLGQLFNELGYYTLARQYIRQGIRIIKNHPEDGKYYRNLINMHFQDGMISLAMNRIDDVEKTMHTIRKLTEHFQDADEGELDLPLAFIRVWIALERKQMKEAKYLMDDMIVALVNEPAIYDCIDDLFTFLRYLTEHKHVSFAKRVIDVIKDTVESGGITHIMLMFNEIMVSYYDAAGNERMVTKQLRKQHELGKQLRTDQRKMHLFSIDLIREVSSLQVEQERIMKENSVLQIQAQTDALTGLPNRHAMNRVMAEAFERAWKNKTSLGVEVLDIDYFKEYNDTYGHQKGDRCLERLADVLNDAAIHDRNVFCARYGGDEFILIFENMTNDEILSFARHLDEQIESLLIRHKKSNFSDYVTVSQGICCGVPRDKNKLWDYLELADSALYAVKNSRHKGRINNGIRLKRMPKTFS